MSETWRPQAGAPWMAMLWAPSTVVLVLGSGRVAGRINADR